MSKRDRRVRTTGAARRRPSSVTGDSGRQAQPASDRARGGWLRTATIVAAALALQVVVWLILYYTLYLGHFPDIWPLGKVQYSWFDISDITIYFEYAGRIAQGARPYVDFPVEYPPLAVPLFTLPGHADNYVVYRAWFSAEMVAACAAAAALTAAAAARLYRDSIRPYIVAAAFAAGVLALGAIIANRYDIVVAVAFALTLLLLAWRRWKLAALVLGLGFALKLTPLILLPLVFILAARRRTIVWGAVYFTLAAALPFMPYALYGRKGIAGLWHIFRYHIDRPLQIESVLATPLLLGNLMHWLWLQVGSAYGSQFAAANGSDFLAKMSFPLMVLALSVTYAFIWRRRALLRAAPHYVPLAVLALVLAFMAFGKVLSPQYFIWILPAIALVIVERKVLGTMLIGILLLTQIEFPSHYWSFVELHRGPVLLVIARDVLLVGAFALSLYELWKLPAAGDGDRVATGR